jgi:hypothetical protein
MHHFREKVPNFRAELYTDNPELPFEQRTQGSNPLSGVPDAKSDGRTSI